MNEIRFPSANGAMPLPTSYGDTDVVNRLTVQLGDLYLHIPSYI